METKKVKKFLTKVRMKVLKSKTFDRKTLRQTFRKKVKRLLLIRLLRVLIFYQLMGVSFCWAYIAMPADDEERKGFAWYAAFLTLMGFISPSN